MAVIYNRRLILPALYLMCYAIFLYYVLIFSKNRPETDAPHKKSESEAYAVNVYSDGVASSIESLTAKHINPNSDDVSLLLSPLLHLARENRCLLLKKGWWTVKFCYGMFIGQMHLEQMHSEWDIQEEHMIGRWNESQLITKEAFTIHRNEIDAHRTYASIVYDNGDTCDSNERPRDTEIQFTCGLNTDRSGLIASREHPACHYIAQVE
eukprot:323945_1